MTKPTVEARIALHARGFHRIRESLRIDIADTDQFRPLRVFRNRLEMVLRDAPATHQCEADLTIAHRGKVAHHAQAFTTLGAGSR